MSEGSNHPRAALQELIDDRLDAEARVAVEEHVAACDTCRRSIEILRWTKRTAARTFDSASVPASLEHRILAALDAEDRSRVRSETVMPPAPSPQSVSALRGRLFRPAAAIAALGLIALVAVLALLLHSPDLPSSVAKDYRAYREGLLALDLSTGNPQVLEGHFVERGLAFRTRVLDLGMMRYELVGGRVHRIGRHASALFVYKGPEGQVLVCQMYQGRLSSLPPAADVRQHGGLVFRVYERKGRTLVFWEEGQVVCVLTSDIPTEELVQLAFAKAMKAS